MKAKFGFGTNNTETDEAVAIEVNKKTEIVQQAREKNLDPDTCNIVRWNSFFFDKDHISLNTGSKPMCLLGGEKTTRVFQ